MDSIETKKRYGAKDVLEKPVGVMSVVGIIYCICCAGAFGIEEMIPIGGPGLTLAMLIVLPFVWALPYSYLVAELGSARPVEGGKLMWVKEALGEYWFGIMVLVNFIWGLIANTVYVVLAVSYLGKEIELNEMQAYILKLGLILLFFLVNVLGIKEVSWVSTTISVLVGAMFLLIAVVGFANFQSSPFEPFVNPDYADSPKMMIMAFGMTLGLGIWMYCGYDEISLIGGEVKGANQVIPKAVLIAIPLIALTYVLPTAGGLAAVPNWYDWTIDPGGVGYATVLTTSPVAPGVLSAVFVFVAILGNLSIYNVCMLAASRTAMILADENMGPKPLAILSKNRGMPVIGLIVVTIATTALLGTPGNPIEFTFLVLFDAFFAIIVAALVTASYIVLKRRIPKEEVPYPAPGGDVGWKVFVALIVFFIICFMYLNGMDYFLAGIGILLLFPVLYCICKWIWKGSAVKEPKEYPIDKRTKLGFGDLTRMGGYYLAFGGIAGIGRLFLSWFEEDENAGYWIAPSDIVDGVVEDDDWANEMIDEFGRDNLQVADAPGNELFGEASRMAEDADPGDLWIPGYYEYEYESGLFSNFYAMLDVVLGICIGAAVVGIVLLVIGKILKKDEPRLKAEAIAKIN